MIQKYLQQIGNPEKFVTEGRYMLSDPHQGEIDLYWKGEHIWGIFDAMDPCLGFNVSAKIRDVVRLREVPLEFIKIPPENPVLWTGMKDASARGRKNIN